jgi:hypothetical protein
MVTDFTKGMRVLYNKPHCQRQYGIVSSIGEYNVFVKFDMLWLCIIDPDAPYTAQACNPTNLEIIHAT